MKATDTAQKPSVIERASVLKRCVHSCEHRERVNRICSPQMTPNRRVLRLLQTRYREACQA